MRWQNCQSAKLA